MADTSPFVDPALEYASRGWAVFPLKQGSKVPITSNGFHDASTDLDQVRRWWRGAPLANIGMSPGPSGLVVVDCDGPDGVAAWGKMSAGRDLTGAVTVPTPGRSGGLHVYFLAPEDEIVATTYVPTEPKNVVQVRAWGGYVVAPPSIHPDGPAYGGGMVLDAPSLVLPEWVPRKGVATGEGDDGAGATVEGKARAERALRRMVRRVRDSYEGSRHVTLVNCALVMGGYLEVLDESTVGTALYRAAREAGVGGREARQAIEWGMSRGAKRPWSLDLDEVAAIDIGLDPRIGTGRTGFDEFSLAQRFIDDRAAGRYVRWYEGKSWLRYSDGIWSDSHGTVMHGLTHWLSRLSARLREEAHDADDRGDEELATALRRLAERLLTVRIADAIERVCRGNQGLVVVADDLDADPWALNTPSGVVDLRTGEIHPHSPERLMTKITAASLDADHNDDGAWERFLARVLPDEDVRKFVQVVLGLALVGEVLEPVIPIFVGEGANGKSVLLNVVMRVLGDYATVASPDLITRPVKHEEVIADLAGRRFVVMGETEAGARIKSALLKTLTGGDERTARHLYGHRFRYKPSDTLVLHSNHLPEVDGRDPALWRRLRKVDFTVVIPEADRDPNLTNDLVEGSGPTVLAWLLDGLKTYLKSGLPSVGAVEAATREYREEHDPVGLFIDERVQVCGGAEARIECGTVYREFRRWWDENYTGDPMNQTSFGRLFRPAMERATGFKQDVRSSRARYYVGITVENGGGGGVEF